MKIGRLTILLLLILAVFSCRRTEVPKPTPMLILVDDVVQTFDPQVPFDESDVILGNIYQSLVTFDTDFRLSPGLATRWTNPDDRTWRFYLNPDARFSDGTLLTAADVRFSIERLKSLSQSDRQAFAEHIASIHEIDIHTVDIKTSTPTMILNNLVFIPILSEKNVRSLEARKGGDFTPIGTGPYKLQRWDRHKKIILEINPNYSPAPSIRQVDFIVRSDPEKAVGYIFSLKADLTLNLPFRKIDDFQKRNPKTSDFRIQSSKGITVYYLLFNVARNSPDYAGKNPLSDVKVRQALAQATNKQEYVSVIAEGFGRPATQAIPPEIFGYDPSLPDASYDPEKASKLLEDAGYSNLEIPIYVTPGSNRMTQLIIDQWTKAGVRASMKVLDEAAYNDAIAEGKFSVTIQGYACTSGEASEFLTFALHTRDEKLGYGSGNYGRYSNPEIDRITEENLRIFNPRERLEMLQKSMRIASQELPYLPLIIFNDVYVVSNRIEWNPPVNGDIRLNQISMKKP